VVPKAWVDCTSGEVYAPAELPYQRTIAFCGLGNPESFWRVLSRLQIHPLEKLDFGDHHAYTPRELRRLGHQGREYNAEALLTTQKDIYNLCEFADSTVAPLKICWLRIGIEIDNEPEFLRLIDG
jgi:tetraacyldisaccharide-1-P 4'-kinase